MLVRDLITQLMMLDPEALVVIPREAGFAPPDKVVSGHFRPHNTAGGWLYIHQRADTLPCVAITATH